MLLAALASWPANNAGEFLFDLLDCEDEPSTERRAGKQYGHPIRGYREVQMWRSQLRTAPMLIIAGGALVVGLAVPAAAHEAGHLIDGRSIAVQSIPGNRLKVNTVTGRQIKESTLGTVPSAEHATTATSATKLPALVWHPITTFENNWVDFGVPERPAAYAVDTQGIVHLRGVIKGGSSGTAAFTLPASVDVGSDEIFIPVVSDDNSYISAIEIFDGSVYPTSGGGDPSDAVTGFTGLDGVTFSANG